MVKMKKTIRLMKSKTNDINIYLSPSINPSLPKNYTKITPLILWVGNPSLTMSTWLLTWKYAPFNSKHINNMMTLMTKVI